ncbi:3-keto-disaccharide hydrolase [Thalassotalea sp. PLHSN55]|uniref:3-keto-disaccharide hydrolase n=1 Tax=Thalassotalea sp. PLHSN55 TaxID=3435888 RepID=UPI003F850A9F
MTNNIIKLSKVSAILIGLITTTATYGNKVDPKLTEIWHPVPKKVQVTPIPSDAIPLLQQASDVEKYWQHTNGKPVNWIYENDRLTVKPKTGSIVTKQSFCDMQLHLEWRAPIVSERRKDAPLHANSGIKIQERYEVQILDTYNNKIYVNGQAGSIYKQAAPLVDALSPSGKWNTFDIIFRAPQFDNAGVLTKPAHITVLHNGVLIQDHFEIEGTTMYVGKAKYFNAHGCKPILLQDHNGEISFRNIWLREL